jgi:hypothetical protein
MVQKKVVDVSKYFEMQLGVTYNVHTSNNDQTRVVLSAIHEKTMQTTQKLIK